MDSVNSTTGTMSNQTNTLQSTAKAGGSGSIVDNRQSSGSSATTAATQHPVARGQGSYQRGGRSRRRPQSDYPRQHSTQPGASNSASRTQGARSSGGKHKQTKATGALLNESTLSGLDVDFAESLAPTLPGSSIKPQSSTRGSPSGNRKLNLSHLLNYSFEKPHRSSPSSFYSRQKFKSQNTSGRGQRSERPLKFSKQQFLQANCQFVVMVGADYSVHSADPDWPIDWDHVEEVRFLQCSSTESVCPICLSTPVAAKITRCGHIFCWPCMLHYLSLSDQNWRQCPICFEIVYKSDLRSVVSRTYTNFGIDDYITLRLMSRIKGCVQVKPYQPSDDRVVIDEKCVTRRNLLVIEPDQLLSNIIEREQKQLEAHLAVEKNEPEACFIQHAISLLCGRKQRLETLIQSRRDTPELNAHLNSLSISAELAGATKSEPSPMFSQNAPTGFRESEMSISTTSKAYDSTTEKSYLFYQSIDGQHIYLNALNTKMLSHEYKSLELCPLVIKARVLQMDWMSMNDNWRKRYRYLEHLPLTCEFRLIELDLSGGTIISAPTFSKFEPDVKKRAHEREKRRREERKREKMIQVEQNRKIYGIQPSLKISLDNQEQFPSVMDERYLNFDSKSHRPMYVSESDYDESHTISSDEEINTNIQSEAPNLEPPCLDLRHEESVPQPCSSIETPLPCGQPFSFRALQLSEEAAAMQAAKAKQAWGQSRPNHSFAQLLTDAKSTEQKWTRFSNPSHSSNAGDGPAVRSRHRSDSCDDSNEESNLVPDFVISNFIEFSVKTSSSKKKGKKKGSQSKGN